MKKSVFLTSFCTILCTAGSVSTAASLPILVQGNERVSTETIRAYFPLHKTANDSDIAETYGTILSNTDLFSQVRVQKKNNSIYVYVHENPYFKNVVFEDNKAITTDDFKKMLDFKSGEIVAPEKIAGWVEVIKELYNMKGHYGSEVEAYFLQKNKTSQDLLFVVKEKPQSLIKKIMFFGNKCFSDAVLRKELVSQEARWYSSIMPKNEEIYWEDRCATDVEKLQKFYMSKGYADVNVAFYQGQISAKNRFYMTFIIQEGQRYDFGKTTFTGIFDKKCADILQKNISWYAGECFDLSKIEASIEKMHKYLNKNGKPFVRIRHTIKRRGKVIDVAIVAEKTKPLYVENITIEGNTHTKNNVILRALLFDENDPLNNYHIEKSKNNLRALDFFEDVDLVVTPGSSDDRNKVTVKVKEKSTSKILFSASYATGGTGLQGSLKTLTSNFLGRGLFFSGSTEASAHSFSADVELINPYFMGKKMDVGIQAFCVFRKTNFAEFLGTSKDKKDKKEHDYSENIVGSTLSASYKLSKNIRQEWIYTLSYEQSKNEQRKDIPLSIINNMNAHKQIVSSSLLHALSYSNFSEKFLSSIFMSYNVNFMGLGGTKQYIKHNVVALLRKYFSRDGKWMLKLKGEYGHIYNTGYTRYTDLFFLGYQSFPGFEESGLGPRTEKHNFGGRQYYTASAKIYFPLGLPLDISLRGVLFAQTGAVWNSFFKDDVPKERNQFQNRVSVGAGIVMELPIFGNLGIIFAKPLSFTEWDKKNKSFFTPTLFIGREF